MNQLKTKSDYTKQFQATLDKAGPERTGLSTRLNKQFKNLDQLIERISQETFW